MRPLWLVHMALLVAAGTCVLGAPTAAQSTRAVIARTTAVELDAVVVDDNSRTVHDLRQSDFQIKEDGRPVTITSFSEVSAAGIGARDDSRYVVLLLDDNAVPLNATLVVQNIAKLFISYARPADTVAVIRLTHREDEVSGDLHAALDRIGDYHAGSLSFFGRTMTDDALQTV